MSEKRFTAHRFFLKDLIRQQIDFAQTQQNRRLPPPPAQKPCQEDGPRIDLPDGRAALARQGQLPLGEAIIQRESVRRYAETPLPLEELSLLLWATQGTRRSMGPTVALRAVPSAGARHALDTNVIANRAAGLPTGLYRYLPFDGQLVQLAIRPTIGLEAARACLAVGAGTCCIAAYDQLACDRLLGVDGEEEFTLYIGAVAKC